ncbi:MAG: metal-dependent hydrolase [Planctomycetota bacterium]
MIKLTWLSHATWLIEVEDRRVVLDPFLTENPSATATVESLGEVTDVLISHGHFDHIADAVELVRRNGAQVYTNYEVATWLGTQGVGGDAAPEPVGMNTGGGIDTGFGRLQFTPAVHSSSLPDGSYGGVAGGWRIQTATIQLYFACDTAWFGDMPFYARDVDLAVLPIGDLFTMGVDDSLAAIKLIEPKAVAPSHYGTWPPINQDAETWADRVRAETSAVPIVPEIGVPFMVPSSP